MIVIYDNDDIRKWKEKLNSCMVALGSFDGVHLGHSKIISILKEKAKRQGVPSVVFTFSPHPYIYFHPREPFLLTDKEEKKILILEKGVDFLVYYPFTPSLSSMDPERFVKEILVEIFNISGIVIGTTHRFGHHRSGDPDLLKKLGKEYGFDTTVVDPVVMDDVVITSTLIRKKVKFGDVGTAKLMLGHPYSVTGIVQEGRKVGSSMGFPTANLEIEDKNKLLPLRGVYAGYTEIGGEKYPCMINIGDNPTLKRKKFLVEAHVIDFTGNLYGSRISIDFYHRIRDELRFPNKEKLEEQLHKDKETVKQLLKKEVFNDQ